MCIVVTSGVFYIEQLTHFVNAGDGLCWVYGRDTLGAVFKIFGLVWAGTGRLMSNSGVDSNLTANPAKYAELCLKNLRVTFYQQDDVRTRYVPADPSLKTTVIFPKYTSARTYYSIV